MTVAGALHQEIEAAKALTPTLNVRRDPADKMDEVLESVRLLSDEVSNLRRVTRMMDPSPELKPFTWAGFQGDQRQKPALDATDIQEEVIRLLEGSSFWLYGFARVGEDGVPTWIMVQSNKEPSERSKAIIRRKLASTFPDTAIKFVGKDGAPRL